MSYSSAKLVFFLKNSLLFNVFYCLCKFVNKHFGNLTVNNSGIHRIKDAKFLGMVYCKHLFSSVVPQKSSILNWVLKLNIQKKNYANKSRFYCLSFKKKTSCVSLSIHILPRLTYKMTYKMKDKMNSQIAFP